MVIAPNKCIFWNRAAYEHKTLADTVSIMKSQQVDEKRKLLKLWKVYWSLHLFGFQSILNYWM